MTGSELRRGFGGDLFATDRSGEIWRVKPARWATLPDAADVAYGNGALNVVSESGGRERVHIAPVPALVTTLGAIKAHYRSRRRVAPTPQRDA